MRGISAAKAAKHPLIAVRKPQKPTKKEVILFDTTKGKSPSSPACVPYKAGSGTDGRYK